MDGGIVLDDSWNTILAAGVQFLPDGSYPTDETGARHRTAERMAAQTGKPVVAVSEGRKVATLFYAGQKIELAAPAEVAAHINQELQSLDRLRGRLDDAEARLTRLEVAGLSSYRAAVTVLQRAELVLRLGQMVEERTLTLGDEGRLVTLQLHDLLGGVEWIARTVLQDYLKPLRPNSASRALQSLRAMTGTDLEDPSKVGKELGFADLDEPAEPRGYRILSDLSRLPDTVREDIVRHFGTLAKLLRADEAALLGVEGVGETRAGQLKSFFARLRDTVDEWEPGLD